MTGKGFALVLGIVCALYLTLHVRTAGWVYEDATWRNGGAWQFDRPGIAAHPDALRMPTLTDTLTHLPNRYLVAWSFYLTPDRPDVAHAINVCVHALNALILALLVTRMGGPGWLAGSLFAGHPLAIEAVAYASGRSELFPALAILAALWCAFGSVGRPWMRVIGFALAVLLGVMSKATVIVILPLLLWIAWQRRQALALAGWAVAPIALAGLVLALRVWFRPTTEVYVPLPRWIAVQTFGAWDLFVASVVPFHLSLDHAWWTIPDGVQVLAVAGLVALIAVLVKAPKSWLVLGVGWFWIALAPRLVVRDTLGWLHEHHAYIALMGLCLAIAAVLEPKAERA